ncbi:hypothetical protein QNO21_10010 [Microbacterium sp. zg-Y818]|uniref:hypothetical protein n=1 Tax=unclassified Microbacterium TaxID=2609290 RepID=UPI00214CC41D|nr:MULTISPECIES: hypothetical protein [unclassified Microbacterium]MCR2799459.1 hypothetical protein [Microbacterium sp. zg.Y818]WIM21456.1 hypothetical protein QNO21_10010 [Microbacterium sp. zg-Y818]
MSTSSPAAEVGAVVRPPTVPTPGSLTRAPLARDDADTHDAVAVSLAAALAGILLGARGAGIAQ